MPSYKIKSRVNYKRFFMKNKINSNKLYRLFYKNSNNQITKRSIRRYLEKLNRFRLINSIRVNKRGGLRKYSILTNINSSTTF